MCNSCNKEFEDDAEQKLHYKSEWHRYNLKRKITGVPGVTEGLFDARQAALAQERIKSFEAPLLYTCGVCDKAYRSSKAHEQHLKSKSHVLNASSQGGTSNNGEKEPAPIEEESEEEEEWVEVDSDEDLKGEDMDESDAREVHGHMHKFHGFFIPDIEYLKDPKGFLTYVGLKVKRDFICLYCNELCHPFSSLEAVRKHMEAKSHCKVHYGDGGDEEDAELEEFYDYSSIYANEGENQMVVSGEPANTVELFGGSELVITKRGENKVTSRTLGSREFIHALLQTEATTIFSEAHRQLSSLEVCLGDPSVVVSFYSYNQRIRHCRILTWMDVKQRRYKSMGLATVQSKEDIVRMKVMREMNKRGARMRVKLGMKSNVIRNLPNNVTY
ncbi:hypothetical protein HID58_082923 [Brassica napus]|uniref:C2H2-type domain-containing protein n=1 Tax=Brassica napus TaxID=3708 RepID=A0ABQ7YC30_BRANA|nr:hypothetical protein HID58_082923 [Brassica napus]